MSDVAVIGMSGKFPNDLNIRSLWKLLIKGGNTFNKLTPDDLIGTEHENYYDKAMYVFRYSRLARQDLFDAKVFKYSPTEALLMDPQHRIFLTCCKEALEYAALPDPELKGFKTGVYAGCSLSSYFIFNILRSKYAEYNPMQLLMATDKDFISTRVAYKLNLRGPAVTVQTGCSTSLVAIHQAYKALISREIDMALAGGASVNALGKVGYFYTPEGAQSSDGICRPFDEKADGTVFSDGVAVVALCRLDDAIKHNLNILAVIKGSAINNNGSDCAGFAAPSINGQADVISRCLEMASIDPRDITAIETHGTGTKLGDPIEIHALKKVFSMRDSNHCAIGSIKANIGHCDTASGVVGFVKAVLCLKNKLFPLQINVDAVNPYLQIENSPFFIPKTNMYLNDKKIINIGVSSFGFGGTNAHLILSSYKKNTTSNDLCNKTQRNYLLLFSAPNKDLLGKYITEAYNKCKTLIHHYQLEDVQYTLLNGRTDYNSRAFVTCSDLRNLDKCEIRYSQLPTKKVRAIFIFPGETKSWSYANHLYKVNHFFKNEVDKLVALFKHETGKDFLSIILSPDTEFSKERVSIVQPISFILEVSLGRMLQSMGVEASEVIGHSLGEISAACFAGIISDDDAVELVLAKAKLIETKTEEGAMIMVYDSELNIQNVLKDIPFDISAYNANSQLVISTSLTNSKIVVELLQNNNIEFEFLPVRNGLHSYLMDPIIQEWRNIGKKVRYNSPKIPMMSTVTTNYVTKATEFQIPDFWANHLREPVQFRQSISKICSSHLKKNTSPIFIEIGRSTNLNILAQAQAPEIKPVSISSGSEQINENSLNTFLGDLWLNGYPFDKSFVAPRGRFISFPISGLDEKVFWIQPNRANFTAGEYQCTESVIKTDEINLESSIEEAKSANSVESIVKRIVGEAFKLPVTSIHDDFDFFAFSGQSMLATTIILKLRKELKLKIPLDTIYNFPVISDLIREISNIKDNN